MRKTFIIGATFLILCFSFGYFTFFVANGVKNGYPLIVSANATCHDVIDSITKYHLVKNITTFKIAVYCLNYKTDIRNGKYHFYATENNFELVKKLRKGQHYPVKFTFNNIRTQKQFLDKVSGKFLFDISDLHELLTDELFLREKGFTKENIISVFIPNSYEFYYNISAEDFFNKMFSYYNEFWNKQRLGLAKELGLLPVEVVTLASIVEEENYKEFEKPIIAGLYINRLKRGMKLQADPTVKFAIGDFSLKRIYNKDTTIDSPYNTYKYYGLPPGPIRIPAISTVDSVLHYTRHNYIFMCAKEDFSGEHNFAETEKEHQKNAAKYHRAMDELYKSNR